MNFTYLSSPSTDFDETFVCDTYTSITCVSSIHLNLFEGPHYIKA